jgi:hypothetical protein
MLTEVIPSIRHRQTLVDEDAPPMTSVNEIPNETNFDSSPHNFQLKARFSCCLPHSSSDNKI